MFKKALICGLLAIILVIVALLFSSAPFSNNNANSHHDFAMNGLASVEKLSPKIAYIFAGSARSFICPKVHWSIKTNLIDALGGDAYTFIRISKEDNLNVKTGVGSVWSPKYSDNEVIETLKLLNPRVLQYFSFSDEIEEMKQNYPGEMHRFYRDNDQRRYSMFYHRCMGYRMVQQYEKDNNLTFDWVVLVRLDAAWLEPILLIESYGNDRVWLTETGFDSFNDQFMLIPRQFSDYLYDLDSKVQKGIYCLGGPDVEKWKCDRSAMIQKGVSADVIKERMEYCCADTAKRNMLGYSEIIHKRHLAAGEIPVSVGHFPVYLTRLRRRGQCVMECERLLFNFKIFYSYYYKAAYQYFAPYQWPDTRGAPMSYFDHSKCLLLQNDSISLWNPESALAIHSSSAYSNLLKQMDYSKSVHAQREAFASSHHSVLMNRKEFEMWRIHPTWNVEGCLAYSFEHKSLQWTECRDHFKFKGGFSYDPQQSFFVQVTPHAEPVQRNAFDGRHGTLRHSKEAYFNDANRVGGNYTRIMLPARHHKVWDDEQFFQCLTILGDIRKYAKVVAQTCDTDRRHPTQIFKTVRGLTRGSHPETTVGRIHSAVQPDLCMQRQGSTERGLSNVVAGDGLMLGDCYSESEQQRVLFEFELIG